MAASTHDTAIIPAPAAVDVVLRAATVTSASNEVDVLGSDFAPGSHYRFWAETQDVWLLFGPDSGLVPAVDQTQTSGSTRPGAYVPAGEYQDFYIDQRRRYFRHVSGDTDGFLSVVKAGK